MSVPDQNFAACDSTSPFDTFHVPLDHNMSGPVGMSLADLPQSVESAVVVTHELPQEPVHAPAVSGDQDPAASVAHDDAVVSDAVANTVADYEVTETSCDAAESEAVPKDAVVEVVGYSGSGGMTETDTPVNSDIEQSENHADIMRQGTAKPQKKSQTVAKDESAPDVEAAASEPKSGFRQLPLAEDVQRAIELSGYQTPTEIQTQIIPHVLAERDVLAQSQTGTGKTAAFALPILSNLQAGQRKPQVLVLAPTRELAMQVARSFETYGSFVDGFDVAAVYGGAGYEAQLRQLKRGVPIVVGTPGRVIDHIKRGSLDLSSLRCLVLDEADEMLNMGFLEDVKFVLEQTPDSRQVALFSATMPDPIRKIAQQYLNDPVRITVKQKTMTAEAIRQRAVIVQHRHKPEVLSRILEVEETDGVIVFTKTREATVTVAEHLTEAGFSAVALNGDMPQAVRERTIAQLKSGRLDVLVATDVAARGLDVSRVSHVINYDIPQDTESYVHRIGRTGRAGRSGEAVILLSNSQRYKLKQIERLTKQPIEVVPPPSVKQINEVRVQKFKDQITEVVSAEDTALLQNILAEYAAETGMSLEVIAAALAFMNQKGRSFFAEELTGQRDRKNRTDRTDRDERDGRRERDRGERSGGRREDRGARPQRRAGRVEAGMDRYRIEVGRDDGVKPGNIVGAIANEAGIEGQYIGPINIYDAYSTIDLPEGMPRDVYQTLQKVRVTGKQLRLRRATEQDNHGVQGKTRGGRPPRPGFQKRHSGKSKPNRKRRA